MAHPWDTAGSIPWCTYCNSHHPVPRDDAHKAALKCVAPDAQNCAEANCVLRAGHDWSHKDKSGMYYSAEKHRPGNVGQYDTSSPFEPIKIIHHYNLNFDLGNVVKYVLRAGKKPGANDIEDLEKARQYIEFEIAERKKRAEGVQA